LYTCHGTHAVAPVKRPNSRSPAPGRLTREALPSTRPRQFLASAHGHAPPRMAERRPALTVTVCRWPAVPKTAADRRKLAQTKSLRILPRQKSEGRRPDAHGREICVFVRQSVHGAALQRALVEAANCVDCHGSHEMNQGWSPVRASQTRIPETCARCHKSQTAEYTQHPCRGLAPGANLRSPVCTRLPRRARHSPSHATRHHRLLTQLSGGLRLVPRLGPRREEIRHGHRRGRGTSPKATTQAARRAAARGGQLRPACHSAHERSKSPLDPTSSVNKAPILIRSLRAVPTLAPTSGSRSAAFTSASAQRQGEPDPLTGRQIFLRSG